MAACGDAREAFRVRWWDAAEDLLADIYRSGPDRRCGFAFLVGGGRYCSDFAGELVGGVPQRLVLAIARVPAEFREALPSLTRCNASVTLLSLLAVVFSC